MLDDLTLAVVAEHRGAAAAPLAGGAGLLVGQLVTFPLVLRLLTAHRTPDARHHPTRGVDRSMSPP